MHFVIKQRTLKRVMQVTGIGLHTGKKVTLTLYPTSANTGIIYRRIDLYPPVDLKVNVQSVGSTMLCTCLIDKNGVKINTVEHLSAAQAGLGIDNIIIEINAPEVPIMDGSADPFVRLLLDAGIQELDSAKKFLKLKKTIRVEENDKWAELRSFNGFTLDFTIDFNHPVITENTRRYFFNFTSKSFVDNISKARTFGFLRDIKNLQSLGFALGGNFDSAIVMDDYSVLNVGGLRFIDEFVRHKILDAIGDLFICGFNIVGSFVAFKSGHSLNNKLLKSVLSCRDAWEIVTFSDKSKNVPLMF